MRYVSGGSPCAQQYFGIVQFGQVAVGDSAESLGFEALNFVGVVYNVTQTVQRTAIFGCGKFGLGLVYGCDYAKAETAVRVNFNSWRWHG